jgi:hypothetical protein
MGAIKRKVLITGLIILSLGVCYKVTSYTMARVKSNVDLIISTSENALIAIPEDITIIVNKVISSKITYSNKKPKDIIYTNDSTEELSDSSEVDGNVVKKELIDDKPFYVQSVETSISTVIVSENFEIKNNMYEDITANIINGQGIFPEVIEIRSGCKVSVPVNIDKIVENNDIDVIIYVTWNNGSAEIDKKVKINIITVPIETKVFPEVTDLAKAEDENKEEKLEEEASKEKYDASEKDYELENDDQIEKDDELVNDVKLKKDISETDISDVENTLENDKEIVKEKSSLNDEELSVDKAINDNSTTTETGTKVLEEDYDSTDDELNTKENQNEKETLNDLIEDDSLTVNENSNEMDNPLHDYNAGVEDKNMEDTEVKSE